MPNILIGFDKDAFLTTGEHLDGWRKTARKSMRPADFISPDAPKLVDFASIACITIVYALFHRIFLDVVVLRSRAFCVFHEKSEPCNLTTIRSEG
jgi:hypothetical protein